MTDESVSTDLFLPWHKQFREDLRDFPATTTLGGLWIAVFLAMLVNQHLWGGGLTWSYFFTGDARNGLRFGAVTLRDFYAGDIWRLLTATFVHFGIMHITINLCGLYQLGCLVESWYGSGPFVMIYILTGAGGNLLSALLRNYLKVSPDVTCAGGSTVIMGLVALCAVVGWILKSRSGDHLRNQMIFVILLTAAIGGASSISGTPRIDNWGHAGGTVVGAVLGLCNGLMIRLGRSALGRNAMTWAGICIIAASGGAQVSQGSTALARQQANALARQQELERDRQTARQIIMAKGHAIGRLEEIRKVYRVVAQPRAITRGVIVRELPRRPKQNEQTPTVTPNPPEKPTGEATKPKSEQPATEKPKLESPKDAKRSSPAETPKTVAPQAVATTPAQKPNQIVLDPEQEFQFVILNSSLRVLASLATQLDTGETSAEFRQAQLLLARTMSEFPTIEEVREFDDHLVSMIQHLKKEREAAANRLRSGK